MAETVPTGPHTPISNLSQETAESVTEQADDPETGSEHGTVEAAGPIEAAGAPPPGAAVTESGLIFESAAPPAPEAQAPDTSGLFDVGAASFADPTILMETVHGVDNRVQINETNKYPYRALASLLITARDGSQWVGTGWFISGRTLATAAHCVYIKNSGLATRDGWVRSIQVMPGRNGSQLPFGSVTSTEFWTVKGWADQGDENFDYAAIIVPTDLGSRVGTFGYGVYTDASLKNQVINVTGYPGDKPSGTMWHDSKAVASTSPTKVHYDIDTAGGQSGAPAYMIKNGLRYAVAVHAYGGAVTNSGTRISPPVFQNLRNWRK